MKKWKVRPTLRSPVDMVHYLFQKARSIYFPVEYDRAQHNVFVAYEEMVFECLMK